MAVDPDNPAEQGVDPSFWTILSQRIDAVSDEHQWITWVFSGIGVVMLAALGKFIKHWFIDKPVPQPPPPEVKVTVAPPTPPEPSSKPERRQRYLERMIQEWNTLRLQALDPAAAEARARPLSTPKKVFRYFAPCKASTDGADRPENLCSGTYPS